MCQAPSPRRLLVLISATGWVNLRAIVCPCVWYSNMYKLIHQESVHTSSEKTIPTYYICYNTKWKLQRKKKTFMNLIINLKYVDVIYLFNIYVILCTGFKQLYPHLVCKSLGILCQYYFPVRCIIFVSNCNKLIFKYFMHMCWVME